MFTAYPLFNQDITGYAGGAEVDVYNQVIRLAASGEYDIQILVSDFGQDDIEEFNNIKLVKLKYMNVTGKSIYHKIIRKIIYFHQLFNIDADIFITKSANEIVGWMALVQKVFRGKKMIYRFALDTETDLEAYKNSLPANGAEKHRQYYLFKYGLYHADVLIAQTERQKNMLKLKLGLDSQVIKNGFCVHENIEVFDKGSILWVARARRNKRPDLFIELAKRLPQKQFIMIAPFDSFNPEESAKVMAMIDEFTRNMDNIRVLGFVPFSEIQVYFDRACLFVNTSDVEGFPNTYIQACLGSTPILSYNVNPDGLIDRYQLGYYCDNNTEKAVDFIKNLTDEKVSYYGGNALKYVKDNHDINKIIEKYIELFRRLVE